MTLLLAIAILPVWVVYVYFLSRSVLLGWISLLAVLLYYYTVVANPFTVGGLHLDVVDIVDLSLLAAGIVRTIPRLRERNKARMFAAAYLFIFAFSLARGISAYGISTAGNEARFFVGLIIACLYFLTAPVDSESVQTYVRVYLYYGLGLTLVAFLAYAGFNVGGVAWADKNPDLGADSDGRLLNSGAALAIAFCFFLSLYESRSRGRAALPKWLPAVFLGLAVLLRHRSVWAVLAAGLVFLLFADKSLVRRLLPVGVLAMFFMAGYALVAGTTAQSLKTEFSDSATNDDTWLWRVEGWQELLMDEQPTATNVLFGKSLGSGFERFSVSVARYVDYPPHNEYISQYLRVGIAGVVLLLCLTILPLRRLWKLSFADNHSVEPSASAWTAVIIGIIVFSIPYQPLVDAYALLGLASAIVFRLEKEPSPSSVLLIGRNKKRADSLISAV